MRVQVELAPFVLENLGCAGNESRLVDCPVFVNEDNGQDYGGYDYGTNSATCDPYKDTFARVACGSSDTASAPCYASRALISQLWARRAR